MTTPDEPPIPDPADVVIQRPAGAGRLFLLFHGAGAGPESLGRLAFRIAAAFPADTVVLVSAPLLPGDEGRGWYSTAGLSNTARAERAGQALPAFIARVRGWQAHAGVTAAETVLVGFSQGGILALEAAKLRPPPAAQVLAFGARFTVLPAEALPAVRIHLVHGVGDRVIGSRHASAAAERLAALSSPVTLDLCPALGHGLDEDSIGRGIARLLKG